MSLRRGIVSCAAIAAVCVVANAQEYDPFTHYDRAMNVLLAWGAASVGSGAVMAFSDNDAVQTIGFQNIAWGAVDAGIAVWAKRSNAVMRTELSRAEKIRRFRRTMVINGLLDVVYVGSGLLLMHYGNEHWRHRGAGVAIQGGFLLLFDWTAYGLTFRG